MTSIQLPEDYPTRVDEDNHTVREYEGANDRVTVERDALYQHSSSDDHTKGSFEFLSSSERVHDETDAPDGEFTGSRDFTGSLLQLKTGHKQGYQDELGNNQQTELTLGNYSSKENSTEGGSSFQEKVSLAQYVTSNTDASGDTDTTKIEFASLSVTDGMPAANLLNLEAINEHGDRQTEWGFGVGFDALGKRKTSGNENDSRSERERHEQESSENVRETIWNSLVGQVYERRDGTDTDGDGKGEYGYKISVPFTNISYGSFEEKTLEERISALEEPINMEKTDQVFSEVIG
ncbi:MAG: hypothetical protein ACFE0J_08665 [Elainellaceae cyanobacterium]